jgi:hypothetical protein
MGHLRGMAHASRNHNSPRLGDPVGVGRAE